MSSSPGRNLSLALFLSLILAGCSSGLPYPRVQRTSSPADQIDPFEYGDEFSLEATTDEDRAPSWESNASPTDNDQPSDEDMPRDLQQTEETDRPLTVNSESSLYQIQLGGVFDNKEEADRYAQRARQRLERPITVEYRAPFYRVIAGSFSEQRDADAYIRYLQEHGFQDSRWILIRTQTP